MTTVRPRGALRGRYDGRQRSALTASTALSYNLSKNRRGSIWGEVFGILSGRMRALSSPGTAQPVVSNSDPEKPGSGAGDLVAGQKHDRSAQRRVVEIAHAISRAGIHRSEERREGKEWFRTCYTRWSPIN